MSISPFSDDASVSSFDIDILVDIGVPALEEVGSKAIPLDVSLAKFKMGYIRADEPFVACNDCVVFDSTIILLC